MLQFLSLSPSLSLPQCFEARDEIVKRAESSDPALIVVEFFGVTWFGSGQLTTLLRILKNNYSVRILLLCRTGLEGKHIGLLMDVLVKNTALESIHIEDDLTGEMVKALVNALTLNNTVCNVHFSNPDTPILTPEDEEEITRMVRSDVRFNSAAMEINQFGMELTARRIRG